VVFDRVMASLEEATDAIVWDRPIAIAWMIKHATANKWHLAVTFYADDELLGVKNPPSSADVPK
jgi:hypothetical protein